MENKKLKFTAVVLAAGSSQRMGTQEKKQFMLLDGMPMVVYSLLAFEADPLISSIVLVAAEEDIGRCMDLCQKFRISKLVRIAAGGNARFRSVYAGLQVVPADTNYVLIHDGARPLLTPVLIDRVCDMVRVSRACIAAVPVKDTIKVGNQAGICIQTPDRRCLWQAQTPQAFSFPLIQKAYQSLFRTIEEYHSDESRITDDAVIVENMTDAKVRLVPGDYANIKVTTPEDVIIADALIRARKAAVRQAMEALELTKRQVQGQDIPDRSEVKENPPADISSEEAGGGTAPDGKTAMTGGEAPDGKAAADGENAPDREAAPDGKTAEL